MTRSFTHPKTFNQEQLTLSHLKHELALFNHAQEIDFKEQSDVCALIFSRSDYIDTLLIQLWHTFEFHLDTNFSLIAVGGFGRRELHPLSDIDLLLLHHGTISPDNQQKISELITLLWDLKLEVGHSVRNLDDCLMIGRDDLTVATNLQEARLICGNERLFDTLKQKISHPDFWPSEKFFRAKLAEQEARHAKYHNTAYNLEPDIKLTPGGLRDIHTLSWIARRHFGATSLREMSKFSFLTDAEFRELNECQTLLWQTRFALHLELKRYDNRLTFSHQASVAERLGYKGEGNQGVELMMKAFYRTLARVTELNKMLIRLFKQEFEPHENSKNIAILSDDFQRIGNQIDARKPALFQARPDTILDLMLHVADDKSVESITAATLRQLRTAKRRLGRFLCQIPEARDKFISLLKHPNALHKAFPLMHKHGVLSAYLPQWNKIVGQMQFDLFHAYTVDEHTMRLLRYISFFTDPAYQSKNPICYDVFPRLPKRELLLLAAIFHDIGKGQKGDHSKIGEKDAYQFCIEHGLSRPDSKFVAWLVRHHLLMSITAQKRDIYDPDVITEFAKTVRDEEHLDYLICLTVADINATNPDLWNSWKRTLLTELYYSAQKMLRGGLENPPDVREKIRHNQHLASAILRKSNFSPYEISTLWQRFKADYFLRHTYKQIAWHCEHILRHESNKPLVLLSKNATRGGTEIFIYHQDKSGLFARVVARLDRKNLSVHDAQIMSSRDGFTLDTFIVLDTKNDAISSDRHDEIKETVTDALIDEKPANPTYRHIPNQLLAFNVKTQVNFLSTRTQKRTRIEIIALDKPGLLAQIGAIFSVLNISLHAAKISTIGERAEDFFTITNHAGKALSPEEQRTLHDALLTTLDKK